LRIEALVEQGELIAQLVDVAQARGFQRADAGCEAVEGGGGVVH
jgi:hypothetical protein